MIPLFDPGAEYALHADEIDEAVLGVLRSGHYILGEQVSGFETEMAAYLGVAHAVGVASGTDALVLSLLACGVGPGDEVVVPAFSFIASAEAVLRVGARPVFADVDPVTACLAPEAFAEACTSATQAVLPVHLYGHPADMGAISAIAAERDIRVIEDNAQGFGARLAGGMTGALGDAGCLSFFPTKTLGAFGDGGMITTPHADVAGSVRALRAHGARGTAHGPGFNSRLDEVQAAALRVKLRAADRTHARRREIAARYATLLAGSPVRVPEESAGAEHTYGVYVVRVADRDAVRERMARRGVATGVYYPRTLPATEVFSGAPGSFPVAERLCDEVLALPMFSAMTDAQVDEVAAVLTAVV